MANSANPDLDLHCLQKQGISGFSRTRVKGIVLLVNFIVQFVSDSKLESCLRKIQLTSRSMNHRIINRQCPENKNHGNKY